MKASAAGVLLLLGAALAVRAQPAAAQAELHCHDSTTLRVIERVASDGPGADLVIRAQAGGASKDSACDDRPQAGDWLLRRSDAERFKAFAGPLVLIDNGTGPTGRQLFVADPAQRRIVRRLPYSKLISADAERIVLWRATTEPPTAANCPQALKWRSQQMNAVIEQQVQLTVPTLAETTLPARRCTARQ